MNFSKNSNNQTGLYYESLAVLRLKEKGIKIIKRNYRFKKNEIDIIAFEEPVVIFLEIKYRKKSQLYSPFLSITNSKKKYIYQCAKGFLKENEYYQKYFCRFDVYFFIEKIIKQKTTIEEFYIKNAFQLTNRFSD